MRPTYAEVEHSLLGRWPETRLDPTLDRISALCRLLGDPQRAYPVVHLTGTNGKTSTARMIDNLLRALDLRTGRFTSPHLQSMTERICLDGEPLDRGPVRRRLLRRGCLRADRGRLDGGRPLSFFEMTVAMAYAAFADAPVDAAVVEVGMGGAWDATNVADGQVSVVTPIAVDHAAYLGDRAETIAAEKSGIVKPGSHLVLAEQEPDVSTSPAARPRGWGHRAPRGHRLRRLPSAHRPGWAADRPARRGRHYDEIFLPLHGAHQARNAGYALAAVEAFTGSHPLDADLVREAFAGTSSPGRLEVVRRSPTVLLDAAHNPHGIQAALEAVQDAFTFSPLVGVVGVMADKDVDEIVRLLEPVLAEIVCTQNSTPRAMPAAELGEIAEDVFGTDRVTVVRRLDDAIDRAIAYRRRGR